MNQSFNKCKSPYIIRHEENQSAIIKNSNSVNPGLVDRNQNQNIQLNNQPNTEDVLKNGDTRNYLNKLAKSMIDNMKEFTSQSVEIFNGNIPNFTQECHLFLKNACKNTFYLNF